MCAKAGISGRLAARPCFPVAGFAGRGCQRQARVHHKAGDANRQADRLPRDRWVGLPTHRYRTNTRGPEHIIRAPAGPVGAIVEFMRTNKSKHVATIRQSRLRRGSS